MENESAMVTGTGYRLTVLTSRLLRLEYSPAGIFEDRPTQTVVSRSFPPVGFSLGETEESIELTTEYLTLFYDKKVFTPQGLMIKCRGESVGNHSVWRYGETGENLGGTARTLDGADGAVALEDGILARLMGYSVLDDSSSCALNADGWVEARKAGGIDLYFFGYGLAYRECLRDFFHLCGPTPLLPRYALGNWWSRYHAYTDAEYLELTGRFRQEEIPLAVAVLDMDWHITAIDPKQGKGWTGYTWNRELFKDPQGFLTKLHRQGLKVTLNLHPADGMLPHEEMYGPMAAALERQSGPIPFAVTDRKFLAAYFKYLHHPHEEAGVDFWWIDWQQGTVSAMPGLDPLWMLNHYHFQDNGRTGRRPLIFSRYAGPGSHRYPIGFSGDTVVSWESLAFQPYFTATAANIGYGWWSHDIGGHMQGSRDDELMARWVAFGVFSPIMRLHSSSGVFSGKEPWKYPPSVKEAIAGFMRFRHRMLPYLYTMNWRCHQAGEQLIQPMYYEYPREGAAYEVPNQYFFGSELLVAPITGRADAGTLCGQVSVWLPEGLYHDIFTGMIYTGRRKIKMYRPLEAIPVLAKAGAIIPLSGEKEARRNGTVLPVELAVWVYAGADGHFTMVEDDGETMAYQRGAYAATEFDFNWHAATSTFFTVKVTEAEDKIIPEGRSYRICFWGVQEPAEPVVSVDHKGIEYLMEYDRERHCLSICPVLPAECREIEIHFPQRLQLAHNDRIGRLAELLNRIQGSNDKKERVYREVLSGKDIPSLVTTLQTLELPTEWFEAICEIILSDCNYCNYCNCDCGEGGNRDKGGGGN